ncbi:MAG: SIMPL domain-containing protein [Candidatus Bathyarchaeota archaeon]
MSSEGLNKRLYVVLTALCVAVVIMAGVTYAAVLNQQTPSETNTLTVSGTGTIDVIPNKAQINVGLLTQADTADDATIENAAKMSNVVASLNGLGLLGEDMKTVSFRVSPVYNYSRMYPEIIGYETINTIQVTTTDLDKVSKIIDEATSAGANQIGNIQFTLTEEKQLEVRDQAIEKAVEEANFKANKLAKSLNIRIVGVKSVTIPDEGLPPIFLVSEVATKDTPIFPGETQVTFRVQVTYILN